MREDLVTLGLIFSELGLPADIDSKDKRITLQKAIYLSQVAGVDLGYRFSWYLNGPYSPALTKDYYELNDEPARDDVTDEWELSDAVSRRLDQTKELIAALPMNGVMTDWLELLSSVHYLVKVKGLSLEEAQQRIRDEKGHLCHVLEKGVAQLQQRQVI